MHFTEDPVILQYKGFINTPPLWTDIGPFGIPQYPISPEFQLPKVPLEELSIPDTLVLGRRMEYFCSHFLKHFSTEKILASNLVVQSGKRTLGELDFILENTETAIRIHMELVYKFYLYDPSIDEELERWIGPNRADSLTRKLHRLKTHQLPLLSLPETEELLHHWNVSPIDFVQRVCFKAHLFVPLATFGDRLPLVNNACIQGYWVRAEEFTAKRYRGFLFHTPSKWNWPIAPSACKTWYSFEEIESRVLQLHQEKKSPLVWMKTPDEGFERIFVVWW